MTEGALKLRRYLARRKLSQAAFARQIGRSRPTVNLWLSGRYLPDMENAAAIERATRIPMRAWTEPAELKAA